MVRSAPDTAVRAPGAEESSAPDSSRYSTVSVHSSSGSDERPREGQGDGAAAELQVCNDRPASLNENFGPYKFGLLVCSLIGFSSWLIRSAIGGSLLLPPGSRRPGPSSNPNPLRPPPSTHAHTEASSTEAPGRDHPPLCWTGVEGISLGIWIDFLFCCILISRSNVRSDHKVRRYIHGDVDRPGCHRVWVLLPDDSRCESAVVLDADPGQWIPRRHIC